MGYGSVENPKDAGQTKHDIPVGRFSVRSSKHLENMVNKTIVYEISPDADWPKRVVFASPGGKNGKSAQVMYVGDLDTQSRRSRRGDRHHRHLHLKI